MKKCKKCGSEYKVNEHPIPQRDKDSIECDICGEELVSWNDGCVFTAKLIKKNEKYKEGKK